MIVRPPYRLWWLSIAGSSLRAGAATGAAAAAGAATGASAAAAEATQSHPSPHWQGTHSPVSGIRPLPLYGPPVILHELDPNALSGPVDC